MVQRYVSLAYSNEEVKTAEDLPAFEYPKLIIKALDEKRVKELKKSFSFRLWCQLWSGKTLAS